MSTGVPLYEPPATQAPARLSDGSTLLGRHTTTSEQRRAAIDHALSLMREQGSTEVRLKVKWSRGAPTILEVTGHVEHVGQAKRQVYVMDSVTEFSEQGADIKADAAARSSQLIAEVSELIDRQMI